MYSRPLTCRMHLQFKTPLRGGTVCVYRIVQVALLGPSDECHVQSVCRVVEAQPSSPLFISVPSKQIV